MILLLILITLAAGVYAGWRAAMWFLNNKMIEENIFLRNHVEQLKQTVSYWKEQADYNREVQNTTIINHNTNLRNTLDNIISYLQNQPKENLKEEEKNQIEHIIKTIKSGISSSHVE